MHNPKTVAEVLNNAANILDSDGWCQGELYSKDGACCACAQANA